MDKKYEENNYEENKNRNYNEDTLIKINKFEEEKHQRDLERIAIEILDEEYRDL